MVKKKTQELQKKWHDACLNLHPKFHQQQNLSSERIAPTPFSMAGLYNPNLLGRPFQPKSPLNKNLGSSLQLSSNPTLVQPSDRVVSPPGSPVTTDLALGKTKATDDNPEQNRKEHIKDFLGCMSSESQGNFSELQSKELLDADSFKKLRIGLTEKVCWQQDAASAVATTVTQCKSGNGKRRGGSTKGDTWLLFLGPDRVGKKKMAEALSELVSGSSPTIISLKPRVRGDGELSDVHRRGKMALDQTAEAIRRNPFSVIVLEDIDEAEILTCGIIKRAMERGRISDSYGREVSLHNVLFILTANWLPENLKYSSCGTSLEEKFANLAKGNWQLRLSLSKRTSKRRPSWLSDEDRSTKTRKEMGSGLSFDLNEAADAEEDRADGSLNSSDLTVDHEENRVLHHHLRSPTMTHDLLDAVDDAIVFKPVDFSSIRRSFSASIRKRFSTIIGRGIPIEVQEEALGKITSGVWLCQTSIDEWIEKALVPSFHQLKSSFNPSMNGEECLVVRLECDGDSDSRSSEHWLPSSVRVVAEGN